MIVKLGAYLYGEMVELYEPIAENGELFFKINLPPERKMEFLKNNMQKGKYIICELRSRERISKFDCIITLLGKDNYGIDIGVKLVSDIYGTGIYSA